MLSGTSGAFATSPDSDDYAGYVAELQRRLHDVGAPADAETAALTDAELRERIEKARYTVRPVYLTDDRKDWHELSDSTIRSLGAASPALVMPQSINDSNDQFVLQTQMLGERYKLCAGEKFEGQHSAAYCSGTLIAKNQVLTAGHCVRELAKNSNVPKAEDIYFVFGYRVETPNGAGAAGTTEFNKKQVYRGKKLVSGSPPNKDDWAIIELKEKVDNGIASPVTDWRKDKVKDEAEVFTIGYPSGLPMKYAPDAKVRTNTKPNYFVATLDTFGGNSGGGVYDDQNKLAGILIRGATDYETVTVNGKQCRKALKCPTSSCLGEDVARISVVKTKAQ